MHPDILDRSPEAMVFEDMIFVFPRGDQGPVALHILERTATIGYFRETKPELRGGLFIRGDCAAMVVQLRIGSIVKYVYTCWLNLQQDADRRVLTALADQDFLMTRFYGSNRKLARLYLVENSLSEMVEKAAPYPEKIPHRSTGAFDTLVSEVMLRFGHGFELWERLDNGIVEIHPESKSR